MILKNRIYLLALNVEKDDPFANLKVSYNIIIYIYIQNVWYYIKSFNNKLNNGSTSPSENYFLMKC